MLIIQSIIALFVWAFAMWLGRNGHFQVSIVMAGIEFAIYTALGTYLIGTTSAYRRTPRHEHGAGGLASQLQCLWLAERSVR
ncbi:MAG: hypothetical protein JW963_05645 [Anaerolineales bacterium]|nr:hypothetical protein [Anaerolineales bacterium]